MKVTPKHASKELVAAGYFFLLLALFIELVMDYTLRGMLGSLKQKPR